MGRSPMHHNFKEVYLLFFNPCHSWMPIARVLHVKEVNGIHTDTLAGDSPKGFGYPQDIQIEASSDDQYFWFK